MKLRKISLLLSISCICLLSGCSLTSTDKSNTSQSTNDTYSKNDNKVSDNSTTESQKEKKPESSNNKNDDSKKNKYLEKLNSIESGLKDLDTYRAGTTLDMKYAASEEYNRWDDALYEIYDELKTSLSSSDMSKLEQEEIKWISEKEKKAKEESNNYKGGTAETLIYTTSLAQSTKDRCYKLVNDYM